MTDDKKFDPEENEDQNDLEFLNRDQYPEDDADGFDLDDDLLDDDIESLPVDEPVIPEDLQDQISAESRDDVDQIMATPLGDDGDPPRRSGSGPSRIMLGAAVVVVALAIWVFWPRGASIDDADLGDSAVLTLAPDGPATTQPAVPGSSDVDLADEVQEMVPEKPVSRQTTPTTTTTPPPTKAVESVSQTTAAASKAGSATTERAAADGEPGAAGKWAIQLGAFGSKKNAERLGDSLKAKGYRVETPAMQTNSGGTSHKVWIAYFATRADADKWAKAHTDGIGTDVYITHR